MPIYEYRCSQCGHEHDALQKFSDAPLTECPACHRAALVKQVSAAGFQLKGSGWYATDFRSKGSAKPAGEGETAKAAGSESAKTAGGDAAAGESKGDAKGESKGDAKGESKGDAKGETKSSGDGPASAASAGSCSPGCACH